MPDDNISKIIHSHKKRKHNDIRKAIIASSQNRYVPMPTKDEIILNVGNMDLRVINGKVQVRTREGIARLKPKEGDDFTTTSTSWVDITGLPKEVEIYPISKQKQTKLKRIFSLLEKSKHVFKTVAENSPLELEWLDVDFGVIRARFKPKRKQTRSQK